MSTTKRSSRTSTELTKKNERIKELTKEIKELTKEIKQMKRMYATNVHVLNQINELEARQDNEINELEKETNYMISTMYETLKLVAAKNNVDMLYDFRA